MILETAKILIQNATIIAVITGFFVTVVNYLAREGLSFTENRKFKKYTGVYNVHKKYNSQEVIFKFKVTVKANKLSLKGKKLSDNTEVRGAILLDPDLPDYGTGHYTHGEDGWGFIQIQITPKGEIHSHMQYSTTNSSLYSDPYVWIKEIFQDNA